MSNITVKDFRTYNIIQTLDDGYVLVQNSADNTIKRVPISFFQGGAVDAAWNNTTVYNIPEVVEYNNKWWKTKIDGNVGIPPVEGASWTEVSKASGQNLSNYAVGVYNLSPSMVIKSDKAYILSENVTLPFDSTDFNAELDAGIWVDAGGDGGGDAFPFPVLNISTSVTPAVPNKTYLVDATSELITIELPNVTTDNEDVFHVKMDISSNHVIVTTVGGTQLIGNATSVEIATEGNSMMFKANGVGGYDIIIDNRTRYIPVTLTTNTDLSQGYESGGVYNCEPVGTAEIEITLPNVLDSHAGFWAKFILAQDSLGSVRLKVLDGITPIGSELEPVIATAGKGLEILDTGTLYQVTQDSRPSLVSSAINLYALDELSAEVPPYLSAVTTTADPDYSITPTDLNIGAVSGLGQVLGGFISDAGVLLGSILETNVISIGNFRRTGGSGVAAFYVEIYKVDEFDVEVLLGTTTQSQAISSATYVQVSASGIIPTTDFLTTDRLLVKVLGNRVAGGSDPIYDLQVEGLDPARVTIAVPSSTISHDSIAGVNDAAIDTTKGHVNSAKPLQFPQRTTAELAQIVIDGDAFLGMKVFNTTTSSFQRYNGIEFVEEIADNIQAKIVQTTEQLLSTQHSTPAMIGNNAVYGYDGVIGASTLPIDTIQTNDTTSAVTPLTAAYTSIGLEITPVNDVNYGHTAAVIAVNNTSLTETAIVQFVVEKNGSFAGEKYSFTIPPNNVTWCRFVDPILSTEIPAGGVVIRILGISDIVGITSVFGIIPTTEMDLFELSPASNVVTREEVPIVNTANVIDVDFNNETQFTGNEAEAVSAGVSITFSNTPTVGEAQLRFEITNTATITFPVGSKMQNTDDRWNDTTRVFTPPENGLYEIVVTIVGSIYLVKISDAYVG